VETTEQEVMLRQLRCDQAQGYLYSAALPAKSFEEKYLKQCTASHLTGTA